MKDVFAFFSRSFPVSDAVFAFIDDPVQEIHIDVGADDLCEPVIAFLFFLHEAESDRERSETFSFTEPL